MSKHEQYTSDSLEDEPINPSMPLPDEHILETDVDDNEKTDEQPNLDDLRSAEL